jgi:hypothetical protein
MSPLAIVDSGETVTNLPQLVCRRHRKSMVWRHGTIEDRQRPHLGAVTENQADLVRIVHRLETILNYKGI